MAKYFRNLTTGLVEEVTSKYTIRLMEGSDTYEEVDGFDKPAGDKPAAAKKPAGDKPAAQNKPAGDKPAEEK